MVQARCGAVDDRDDVCRRGATLEEHAVPGSKKPLKFSGNAFELGDLYSQARAGVPAFPRLARKRPRLTRGAFCGPRTPWTGYKLDRRTWEAILYAEVAPLQQGADNRVFAKPRGCGRLSHVHELPALWPRDDILRVLPDLALMRRAAYLLRLPLRTDRSAERD